MNDLKLYVKQDGMYITQEVVLSNIPIKDIQGWYLIDISLNSMSFSSFLLKIYKTFMDDTTDTNFIRVIDYKIPDEIIITKRDIEIMNPHEFI